MLQICFASLVILMGAISPVQAAEYYLDTANGDDSNTGTASQPWKTLSRVQSAAASGDTIFIQQADLATYAAAWPQHVSYKAKALQQFEITWQFDGYYTVGKFVTGDFWVVGPVTIVGIDPPSTLVDDRVKNGSMLNPSPQDAKKQGYDSAMPHCPYEASLNVAFGLGVEKPLVVSAHSSLVSTISHAAFATPSAANPGGVPLKRAVVLTVLPSAAASGSFRPPYCGTVKNIQFNESQLKYELLRNLTPVNKVPSIATWAGLMQGPWLDHIPDWVARYHHPSDNMPAYGREIHTRIGVAALLLHCNYTQEQKKPLLINFVQLGIDLYGVLADGGIKNWTDGAGHTIGRKWPILFAGLMLNDPAMTNIGEKSGRYLYEVEGYGPGNAPPDYIHFGEDDQTFYVSAFDVAITHGPTWNPDYRDEVKTPYEESDIGLPEWGIMHTRNPEKSNKWLGTIYRDVSGPPFHATALAALIMDAKALWNHDAYFDYTDRYMDFTAPGGGWAGWWRSMDDWTELMWDTYRQNYGPIWPETGDANAPVLSYIGNKQVALGETLTFTVSATDANGDALTYTAAGLPTGATFSNRTFTWTPSADSIGTRQVTFTVSDGSTQDSETITITVTRSNDAPVLLAIGNKTANENQAIGFSISATDANGDAITYSASGLPTGAAFTGQTFTWTPGYDQAGDYSVTFIASDGLAQDSETITISVANVNRAPALAEIGDRSVDQDDTLSFTVSAVDADGGTPTYSATGLPSGASFLGQSFTWTPAASQIGSYDITFVASDGESADSETITVTVVSTSPDQTPPTVARQSPAAGTIQVPLNNVVMLHVTDAGRGVAADSVRITVDGELVYEGNTTLYTGASGRCSRSGTKNDYEFIYQRDETFDFDHTVTVAVNATDVMGNTMSEVSYSFTTEMRAFGGNIQVSRANEATTGSPATVADSDGNIWAAWHAGPEGARDIYVAQLPAGEEAFETPVQVTTDAADQCNPDITLGSNGTLYVVWQDNRRGNWDVFVSLTSDGRTFTRATLVTDSNDNEIEPVVAVDSGSPARVYVAWQDDRSGNQDIYVASSTNAFASITTSAVTTDAADQLAPDIAVDAGNTAYLVWTDKRNGLADIYGASSASSWANRPLVTSAGSQTDPALAIAPGGSLLHWVWVDSASGDTNICYASSSGLPSAPVTGASLIDDTSGAAQSDPAIACSADGKVFVCWQDARNIGAYGADTDVYFAEIGSGAGKTNILIGDGGSEANQSEPAIAVTAVGQPYVIWTDDRTTATEIYCAATTYVDPTPLHSTLVVAATGATVGANPAAINDTDDVSIVVPAGACPTDLRITISKILNPLVSSSDCLGSYDFGPSGIDFDKAVTVTIPYVVSAASGRASAYWYDSLTGALSQQGITDIENITIRDGLCALRFKTTHFTPYYVVADHAPVIASSSNDGGGGCSLSPHANGSPRHLLVPYGLVVVATITLRRRDKRRAMRCVES
ncbi:MAG TPA: putative Ig domain-containing protein [Sedimentisphaerales bacterium]|nr:putative Ig domain-containing protein [Sedimentisphaerales bacterium]HNU29438.1 putative Ig domain-containing protein [Sedimentisphaerales bacterium]